MPSPFPGMNPYLEQADAWNDFHLSYIVLIRDALRSQIDPSYIITHTMKLSDAPKGYELFKHKQDDCLKVVLKP